MKDQKSGAPVRPQRLSLQHTRPWLRQVAKCLARAGEGHKAAKKRLKAGEAAGVAKVIGTSKLRTKYESHEAKRALCGAYDLFLADERILPSLPKLLGAPPPRRRSQATPWRCERA